LRRLQKGELNPKNLLGLPAEKAKLKGVRVVWIGRPKSNPYKFFLHGFGSGTLANEQTRKSGAIRVYVFSHECLIGCGLPSSPRLTFLAPIYPQKQNIRAFVAKLLAAHLPCANLASKTHHSCIRG
jgi:hypothetical protein